ncbi:hypothetical protein C8F01DRAFT_1158438 [Mycena amicta]|nr:hypothetical protein C8F01DRAFT_1158438 [Mycena amicta]
MLPLYWIILDPSRIPSAAELDDLSSPFSGCTILLQAVMLALLGVHQGTLGNPEKEQYRDIWSRLYPWIQFLQAHYDLLPWACHEHSEKTLLMSFLNISAYIFLEELDTLHKVPGIMHLVFRAWRLALGPNGDALRLSDLTSLGVQLPTGEPKLGRAGLDDVISGSGGTLDAVAAIMATHVQCLVQKLNGPASSADRENYLKILGCMRSAMEAVADAVSSLCSSESSAVSFMVILERRLSVNTLTNGLRQLARIAASNDLLEEPGMESIGVEMATYGLSGIIYHYTLTSRVHLSTALQHGFLRSLAACCQRKLSALLSSDIQELITQVLQPCTMFSSLNRNLLEALAAAHEFASTPAFRASEFIQHWDVLVEMATTHSHAFDSSSDPEPRRGACDNLACGRIDVKTRFRRCSGCEARLYCNSECQKTDWNEGKHRDTCALYRATRRSMLQIIRPRELHDIRAVLAMHSKGPFHDAYSTTTIISGPSRRVNLVFTIDFSEWVLENKQLQEYGPKLRSIGPAHAKKMHDSIRAAVPTWDDWTARAQRSHGRMALHVVRFFLGTHQRILVMPMRANSAFVRDAGRRIWKKLEVERPVFLGELPEMRFAREWEKVELPKDLIQVYC